MTILKQRKGCRRGGVRGRPLRHASSASKYTTTESLPIRGRSRGRGRGHRAAISDPHHSHEHSACFQIPCRLSNHSFVATVTIQLSEGVADVADATTRDLPSTSQNHRQQCQVLINSSLLAQPAMAHSNPPDDGRQPYDKGLSSDEDDLSSYGCRIVEELPSYAHDP